MVYAPRFIGLARFPRYGLILRSCLTFRHSHGGIALETEENFHQVARWLLWVVSSIDQRNTLSYLLEMECDDETSNPHLLECCTTSGYLGSLAAWRIHEFNWPPL